VHILLILVFAYLLVFFFLADFEKVLSRTPDDAAYYFEIAENIASGKGSTFDGFSRTNGYHPLWLALLAAFAKVLRFDPETMFRIYLLLETVIVFLAAWLLFVENARIFPPHVVFFCAAVFVTLVFFQSVNGMETGVVLLGIAVLYAFGTKRRVFTEHVPRDAFIFGVFLGFTMLARLDMIWLGASVCGFCLYLSLCKPRNRREGFTRLLLVFSGAALVVLPYLIYNAIFFGSVMPLSGLLKISFPRVGIGTAKLKLVGPVYLTFVLMAVFYLPWSVNDWRKRTALENGLAYFRGSMIVLSVAILLHFLHTVIFVEWAIFGWHFMPYALLAALLVSEPAYLILSSARFAKFKTLFVVLGVVLLLVGGNRIVEKTFLKNLEDNWRVRSYRAAVWARDNSATSDVFAMKEAGNFGYFSQRSVINLDGLVNDVEYQEALRDKALNAYFTERNVKYVVQHGILRKDANLLNEISGGNADFNGSTAAITRRFLCDTSATCTASTATP
jgi:hypothetical protein